MASNPAMPVGAFAVGLFSLARLDIESSPLGLPIAQLECCRSTYKGTASATRPVTGVRQSAICT
jgi:hypothetical protein